MSERQEIIVVGGGYNPPTVAHQAIITACLEEPGFEEVWVMPSRERWDKSIATTDADRPAMLSAMRTETFADDERLHISSFELELPAPTQTVLTASALAIAHANTRFWYAFGADSYAGMLSWNGGEELRRTLPMLLAERPGYSLPPESGHIRHLRMDADRETMCVSSSEVRNLVRQGRPITGLVCPSVQQYIETHGLYRDEPEVTVARK